MRISLQTHGGIAGGIRRPASSIDVASLGEEQAGKTTQLVETARRASPQAPQSNVRPDEVSYTITIEDAGKVTTLSQDETSMSPEFAALLDWLQELLRGRR